MVRAWIVPMVLVGALVLGGCSATGVTDTQKRLLNGEEVAKREPNAAYVVYPPDKLRIEAQDQPDLTREVVVRQDGFVSLALLQDVKVSGLTPVKIKTLLEDKDHYGKYYNDIRILVTVTDFASKRVFVYGEVPGRQGTLPYTGSETVRDLMGLVGGYTWRAAPGRARVARGDVDNPEIFPVNLKKLLHEGDQRENVLLAENDVLYVPPNVFAWVGYQVDNLLFPFRSLLSGALTYEGLRTLDQTANTNTLR